MVVVSGDSSARLLPVPCVTGRRSARQCDGLPNEVLLFGFVLQSWARLRMSPPLSLPWSWMDWRSTPTTASRCWPSPAQGMASEASRSSPAPKRMVRHRCVGTGWETQILNVPGTHWSGVWAEAPASFTQVFTALLHSPAGVRPSPSSDPA